MAKRVFLTLLFTAPLALVLAMVWYHRVHWADNWITARPARLASAGLESSQLNELGIANGITSREIQDAMAAFAKERNMWAKLKSISAEIKIDFEGNDGDKFSLTGNMSINQIGWEQYLATGGSNMVARYEMTIADKQGAWSVTTDGTTNNTVINCEDQKTSESIAAMRVESVLNMLTFPHYMPPSLYQDRDGYLRWEPWLTTNAPPRTLTFFSINSDSHGVRTDFSLENGHISRWRRTKTSPGDRVYELLVIDFKNPVQANGFWFPTAVTMVPAPAPWPYPGMQQGFFAPVASPFPAKGKGKVVVSLFGIKIKTR